MAIKAKRGTEVREFNEIVWANMPKDKYGWKLEAEVPEEVAALQKGETNAVPPAKDYQLQKSVDRIEELEGLLLGVRDDNATLVEKNQTLETELTEVKEANARLMNEYLDLNKKFEEVQAKLSENSSSNQPETTGTTNQDDPTGSTDKEKAGPRKGKQS